jgi:prefoldin subunit 5
MNYRRKRQQLDAIIEMYRPVDKDIQYIQSFLNRVETLMQEIRNLPDCPWKDQR